MVLGGAKSWGGWFKVIIYYDYQLYCKLSGVVINYLQTLKYMNVFQRGKDRGGGDQFLGGGGGGWGGVVDRSRHHDHRLSVLFKKLRVMSMIVT